MDFPMDKEIALFQQKLAEAQLRLRSVEIDLEILRANPYAGEGEVMALNRLQLGLAFNVRELEKRLEGVEKALRGDEGEKSKRKGK